MNYKLSICIPTYNRETSLRRLLPPLLEKINRCPEKIQLCLSDNGSTDGTAGYLDELARENPCLKIVHQPENVRFGRNFWRVGGAADGEFLYFTGDDDPFVPEALEHLLKGVQAAAAENQLILFRSHSSHALEARQLPEGEILTLHKLPEYLDLLSLFFASFIGNLMFRKSFFSRFKAEETVVDQSAYPHMIAVFQAFREGPVLFVNHPITVPDNQQRSWTGAQGIYTSVDMARLLREYALSQLGFFSGCRQLLICARSLPKAFRFYREACRSYYREKKTCNWCALGIPDQSRYSNMGFRNLLFIYSGIGRYPAKKQSNHFISEIK